MSGTLRFLLFLVLLAVLLINTTGCGDKNFEAGMYWLEKENNPTMAARAFQRSLEDRPKHWKTNKMAIHALALSENVQKFENQLRLTLQYFPDSSRSVSIHEPAVGLIGEKRYNLISAPYAQDHYSKLVGKKGDKPPLLSNLIMASCRAQDTVVAVDYFKRLLGASQDNEAPDSVIQELEFLIGPAGVEWVSLGWKVAKHPDDTEARIAQINAGLVVGDSAGTRARLLEMIKRLPETGKDPNVAKRYGKLIGIDPFISKAIVEGWEGSFSNDGKKIIYIKDLGRKNEPDPYIYIAAANGSGEKPIMKANQQALPSIAWPVLSPDNRWVYFYGSPTKGWTPERSIGRFHLYRIKPYYGAAPRKLTDADLLPVIPHFESNGSLLLVQRDVGSARASVEVVRLKPEKRKMETISRIGEPVSGATFTSKGDSLIFTTDRGIFRRSVEGGNITVDLARRGLFFPLVSQDGKHLLVYNRENQALLIDRADGELTYLGRTAVPLGSFSTDGKLLLTQVIKERKQVIRLDLLEKHELTEKFQAAIN